MKCLIAHPDHFVQRAIEVALRDLHFITTPARDGLDVVDKALDELPDAIILGTHLAGLGGLDVARTCRALEPTRQVPILFVTNDLHDTESVRLAGLSAVEWTQLPLDLPRVREKIVAITAQATERARQGVTSENELVGIHDPVTGLYGRTYMLHRLAYEAASATRYDIPLAVILIGVTRAESQEKVMELPLIDHALVRIADILKKSLRQVDLLGRTDTDQFLIIAPHTDTPGAQAVSARIRASLVRTLVVAGEGEPLGVRIGVAVTINPNLTDNLALFARAQTALDIARRDIKTPIVVG